jgi:hypothetical protein
MQNIQKDTKKYTKTHRKNFRNFNKNFNETGVQIARHSGVISKKNEGKMKRGPGPKGKRILDYPNVSGTLD